MTVTSSGLMVKSLQRLLPGLLLAVPIGHFVGAAYGWAVLFFSALILLFLEHRHLARLALWSTHPDNNSSLEGQGAWDEVFGRLYLHNKLLLTKIKRWDEELRRFWEAGHALHDGVVMLDRLNRIEWCNAGAETQLGLVLKYDNGQPIVNLVRKPEFVSYVTAGEFEKPLVMYSDRGDRTLSVKFTRFSQDRHLLQITDVTQASLLDQMRRDFVANVSHELRTPLTVLAGFIETLSEQDVAREEAQRYLQLMSEQSDRMLAIVQDLLTLSSLESAQLPDHALVDMTSLLERLRQDAEALSEGQHQIAFDVDTGLDICGSEAEIVSAFSNLIANAIRYTPPNGRITVSWKGTETEQAEFVVTDTGIGIDSRHIPRLTERFYRVDRGRSREAGGTGLGLSIVKHSLQRHQAQLKISSEPGKGSRFSAVFPANRVKVHDASDD